MASFFDLAERLEQTIGNDPRIHIETHYHGGRLPGYLSQPVDQTAANAGERIPITIINVKHHSVDGSLVLMNLCDLIRLLASQPAPAFSRNGDG